MCIKIKENRLWIVGMTVSSQSVQSGGGKGEAPAVAGSALPERSERGEGASEGEPGVVLHRHRTVGPPLQIQRPDHQRRPSAQHMWWVQSVCRLHCSSEVNSYLKNKKHSALPHTERENRICDQECSEDGCWGPGPTMCVSCQHFDRRGRCVPLCNLLQG